MALDAHSKKRPSKDFALSKGHYPIYDLKHAKLALNPFFLQHASGSEQKKIRRNVYAKYPNLKRADTDKAFKEGVQHNKY